ncbi:MAG: dihydrodipicolinate synthase family protein [SAR324 cluster bacterium]|nr:dihydrodipicolinate synthase family protein [SAR324 cluster bacterium]
MNPNAVKFEGVFPILVTPFHDDESLDLEAFHRIVRAMADRGVDGVTILGVLGEANRLTDREREQLIEGAVKAAAGRIPIVVGTSHSGTAVARDLSQMAESLGAAGVMVTPSREPVPNEERIFQYFQQVADAISIPIVVQDHPGSTQVHMSVPLLLRLVEEIPAVACIKAEALPSPQKVTALLEGMAGRQVTVLSGLGALYGLFDLERGSHGFMTGFAFPEALQAMVSAARAGDWEAAWRVYHRFLPLIVFEQQPGLAIRKEVYRLRGLIGSNRVRHPGATIDPKTAQHLANLIQRVLPDSDLTQPIPLEGG